MHNLPSGKEVRPAAGFSVFMKICYYLNRKPVMALPKIIRTNEFIQAENR